MHVIYTRKMLTLDSQKGIEYLQGPPAFQIYMNTLTFRFPSALLEIPDDCILVRNT